MGEGNVARRPLRSARGVVAGVVRALPRALEDIFGDRCPQYAASKAGMLGMTSY